MNFDLKQKKHTLNQDDELLTPPKKRTKIAYETLNDEKSLKNDYQESLFTVKHVNYIDNKIELQLIKYLTNKEVQCILNDSW